VLFKWGQKKVKKSEKKLTREGKDGWTSSTGEERNLLFFAIFAPKVMLLTVFSCFSGYFLLY
jgi:hypothetical protein